MIEQFNHMQSKTNRGATSSLASSLKESRNKYPGLDGVLSEAKRLVEKYRGDHYVRTLALRVSKGISKNRNTGHPDMRNFKAVADAMYKWIIKNVVYVRDPHGIERLQSPDVTVKLGAGDCDDMSILSAALLESVGIPTRFVIASYSPGQPKRFSHIYVEFNHKGQWIPFDPTLGTRSGAVSSSPIIGKRTISLNDSNLGDRSKKMLMDHSLHGYTPNPGGSRLFLQKKKYIA